MKKYSLIFVLLFFFTPCFAQKNEIARLSRQDSINFMNKIERLEGMKENLKDGLDNKFNDYKNGNERQLNTIYVVLGAIAIISGLGLFGIFRNFKERIIKTMENELSNLVAREKEKIIQLIKDQDFEISLKKDQKILLVSFSEEENNKIRTFFAKYLDFRKVETLILNDIENIKNTKIKTADVVLINGINDIKNPTNKELILKLTEAYNSYQPCFVFYGTFLPELGGKKNINFANSEFTIYTRILETLKTQYILLNKN